MSLSMKRKRGRPRHDESREINNSDVLLVQEFQRFPALYDRNDDQYKNREFVEELWHNMAVKFGCDVEVLKSRINQLRNRYSVEKRRLEHLRTQYQDPSFESHWVLFNSMEFMGEHIKSRRPYPKGRADEQPSNSSDGDTEAPEKKPYMRQQLPVTNGEAAHSTVHNANSSNYEVPHSQPDVTEPIINVDFPTQNLSFNGAQKYHAFADFVSASLIDMPESNALHLVEKFTSQLVSSLMEEKYKPS